MERERENNGPEEANVIFFPRGRANRLLLKMTRDIQRRIAVSSIPTEADEMERQQSRQRRLESGLASDASFTGQMINAVKRTIFAHPEFKDRACISTVEAKGGMVTICDGKRYQVIELEITIVSTTPDETGLKFKKTLKLEIPEGKNPFSPIDLREMFAGWHNIVVSI